MIKQAFPAYALREQKRYLCRHLVKPISMKLRSLISRIQELNAHLDDVMNFKIGDLMSNIEFLNTIKSKMRRNKNVLEERDSPDKIIFESMN